MRIFHRKNHFADNKQAQQDMQSATNDCPSDVYNTMSAGSGILFIILTITIGVILNSSHLYIRTSTMDTSPTRTFTLAILSPFDRTTRAFGLTAVRQSTRSILKLPRDDKIDTFIFYKISNTTQVPAQETSLPVLSQNNKLTMWIIGDSLAVTPGESMLENFPTSSIDIKGLSGKVATGIARPDFFNWFSFINEFVTANHPQAIVITIGANDDQNLYSDSGPIGPFGSEAWKQEYANRINSTLDFLSSQGTYTIWVAIPPVRDPVRNERYKIINDVTRSSVLGHPTSASYIETAPYFTNPDGSYSDSLPINGLPVLLRAQDGIHFTRAGGDVIARLVLEKLHTLYSF